MSNNNRTNRDNRDNRTEAGSEITDAIKNAGITLPGPANAADIIEEMVDAQADHLKELKSLYGEVEVSSKDGAVSERYGRKSCEVMEMIVTIPSVGLRIVGSLYGNLETKAEGTFVNFTAYVAPKSVKYVDSDAKDRLLAIMEHAACAWPGYEKATAAAERRLLGGNKSSGATVGAFDRPRLVKRIVAATAATA